MIGSGSSDSTRPVSSSSSATLIVYCDVGVALVVEEQEARLGRNRRRARTDAERPGARA